LCYNREISQTQKHMSEDPTKKAPAPEAPKEGAPKAGASKPDAAAEKIATDTKAKVDAAVGKETSKGTEHADSHQSGSHDSPEHGHGDDHGHEGHGKDTIQGLIDAARKFETAGHHHVKFPPAGDMSKISGAEKRNAGIMAGTTATVAAAPLWGGVPVLSTLNAAVQGFVQEIPFVGPSIVQGATALQGAAASTFNSLGVWGTAGAVPAVLGGLWLAGKAKSVITRKEYSGIARPIYEAVRTPFELAYLGAKVPYDMVIHGPGYIADKTYKAGKYVWKKAVTQPKEWLKDNLWNPYMKPALKPSVWGVGAGLGGATILAPFTGGSSLLVGAAAYAAANFANHYGWLKAGAGADAHGGHH
jgi:hypothetical protein